MNAPKLSGLDEAYAKQAFRVLVRPRDMEWLRSAELLLDEAPDYAYEKKRNGERKAPKDVFELAGRILGYCAGLVDE